MKKLAIGLCLFVGIICRSEAQLDGEYTYTYDLLKTFNKNFLIMRDYTENFSVTAFTLMSGGGGKQQLLLHGQFKSQPEIGIGVYGGIGGRLCGIG